MTVHSRPCRQWSAAATTSGEGTGSSATPDACRGPASSRASPNPAAVLAIMRCAADSGSAAAKKWRHGLQSSSGAKLRAGSSSRCSGLVPCASDSASAATAPSRAFSAAQLWSCRMHMNRFEDENVPL